MIDSRYCIVLVSGVFLSAAFQSRAQDTLFNPNLLEIDHPVNIDIRQFNRSNTLPPGNYKVDVVINGRFLNGRILNLFRIHQRVNFILALSP